MPTCLVYCKDCSPGFRRVRHGEDFSYVDADGGKVHDREVLARIERLTIPPAWEDVVIAQNPAAHLQATGCDVKGRRQYRYHEEWRAARDAAKFDRLAEFGRSLPGLRRKLGHFLGETGVSKKRVLAAVVRLLDTTLIRIGNDEYARTNDSYGLTTLRKRHATIHGTSVEFCFRGKSGKCHQIRFDDPRLAKIVKKCQELPGQELFGYVDDGGTVHDVGSADVNAFLHEICAAEITAKDFRTWHGTVLALHTLTKMGKPAGPVEAKRNISAAMKEVSSALGNTPAVCRTSYVHPQLLEFYRNGKDFPPSPAKPVGLDTAERRLLAFLSHIGSAKKKRRLARERTSRRVA